MESCSLVRRLFSDDSRIPPGIPVTLAEPAVPDPFEEQTRLKGGDPAPELVATPIATVDPVAPGYYLEQLAERFRQAVRTGR